MKNKMALIPLLAMSPVLFMGAGLSARYPYAIPDGYENFEITDLSYSEPDAYNNYTLTVTLKNTGDGYLGTDDQNFIVSIRDDYHGFSNVITAERGNDFYIPPHESAVLVCQGVFSQKYELDELEFSARGFKDFQPMRYSNIKLVETVIEEEAPNALYRFEIEEAEMPESGYYTKVIDCTVDGNHVAFINPGQDTSFSLALLDKTLVEEDFVFNRVFLIEGPGPYPEGSIYGVLGDVLSGILIIFLVVIGLALIAPAIIIPIVVVTKRNKNKA